MNHLDKRHQQPAARSHARAHAAPRWRIGLATVSTEELQAWQLGPARLDGLLDRPLQHGRG